MNEFIIKPLNNDHGFYINMGAKDVLDEIIAHKIGISPINYKKILRYEFNGKLFLGSEVFFKDIKDAEKALEWVESMYILNKLVGVNNG